MKPNLIPQALHLHLQSLGLGVPALCYLLYLCLKVVHDLLKLLHFPLKG